MPTTFVNIGSVPNDGTGDPIRTAFGTVNENFDLINGALFAGTESTIISAFSLTSGSIVSNSYILADSWVNADSIVSNTITSSGHLRVNSNGAYIVGNVNIIGSLNVSGTQTQTQTQQSTSPILGLHYSPTPLVIDDGKDIGLEWQYFKGAEKKAFLGWQNSTGSLVYLDDITDVGNVITAGVFGNVQIGSLLISNTTATTSNTSGALKVVGGISTLGNLYVAGNIVTTTTTTANLSVTGNVVGSMYFNSGDTIFINGSPVVTSASAFNGGPVGLDTQFNSTTAATSLSTGAVRVAGGAAITGNLIVGANIVMPASTVNRIFGNLSGRVLTADQTAITSLGTLTGLSVAGQINTRDIIPETNLTYSLGTSTNTRFAKIWAFDADFSGVLATSGTITTTAASASIFNSGATTVSIGGGGSTVFSSNTQATSTTTGAVRITGGASIATGNLYIGGSGGVSIRHVGSIIPESNLVFNLGSTTNWYNTFYGVSTQAKYADLAENYTPDAEYEAGTVVVFGGDQEITVTSDFADPRVAGVISTNPAYLMNAAAEGLPVALRGRVPVRVVGPVLKGDLLVTSTTPGYARSVGRDNGYGAAVFAKSITQDLSNGTKIIEAVIL